MTTENRLERYLLSLNKETVMTAEMEEAMRKAYLRGVSDEKEEQRFYRMVEQHTARIQHEEIVGLRAKIVEQDYEKIRVDASIAALNALLAFCENETSVECLEYVLTADDYARKSVELADALVKELQKPKSQTK